MVSSRSGPIHLNGDMRVPLIAPQGAGPILTPLVRFRGTDSATPHSMRGRHARCNRRHRRIRGPPQGDPCTTRKSSPRPPIRCATSMRGSSREIPSSTPRSRCCRGSGAAKAGPWPRRALSPPPRAGGAWAGSVVFVAAALGGGGPARPTVQATDSILVQLEAGAAPPARSGRDDVGPPIVALTSVASDGPEDAPLLRVPIEEGSDPAAAAEDAAATPGVAFAEPVYMYQTNRAPNDPRYKDLWGMAKIN